jgi:hypothetical protein
VPAPDDDPESQVERRRVLHNDADVRRQEQQQSGTYLSHTHSETGGRFAVAEHQIITGVASPKPPQLPANSPWSGAQPQPPDEPALGFPIDQMSIDEPSTIEPLWVEQLGVPAGAAASANVAPPDADAEPDDAGAPSFSSNQQKGEC